MPTLHLLYKYNCIQETQDYCYDYHYVPYNIDLFQFLAGRVSVILSRVTLFSAGLYSCEVSADFPDYDTEIRRQHMHVFGEWGRELATPLLLLPALCFDLKHL